MENEIFLFLALIGFIAGFIDAVAGGGGLLTLPALLSVGVPPHIALGTNKLAATFGSFQSARIFIQKKIFKPKLWLAVTISVFIGTVLGTLATLLVSSEQFEIVIPILVLSLAIYLLIPKSKKQSHKSVPHSQYNKLSGKAAGTILGFYDGFLGPGTGAFWTTIAMSLYKFNILEASGVARFMNFISNGVAMITFMLLQFVDYRIGLSMGIAIMLGAYIGAKSAIYFGANFIKPIFLTVVVLMAANLIWKHWI